MSNTTPTPGSRFTVEDAGSTTNAADLFQNDTTAGTAPSGTDTHRTTDEDAIAAADSLAAAGAGTRSTSPTDPTPERAHETAAVISDEQATASRPTGASDTPPSPATPSAPGAPEAPSAPSGGLADLIGDPSIGHVFDQTNGVIDRLDGDSDGTADSDDLSSAERADENPAFLAFADTEAAGTDDAEDTRRVGN